MRLLQFVLGILLEDLCFLGWIPTKRNYKGLTEKSEAFAKPPQNFTDMCTFDACNSLMKTILFIKLVTDSTNIKGGR